ncbi:protein PAXX isoform X2 [Onychostruthus taczanowskii]|uniref:protein PAXX isoform X2 n=1 Tax=Onychostruthus taczanowskii TaxID=356909 RepID=UPI001B80646B|nr:protein PAXX isoform X2 [Onychostruthus taczanowskii]
MARLSGPARGRIRPFRRAHGGTGRVVSCAANRDGPIPLLLRIRRRCLRCPPEEHGAMLRAALGHGAAALSLGPGSAALLLPEEPQCPALALAQLPAAEARSQLQALLFGMAGCIESLERRLEAVETLASSCSPEKNAARSQQLFLPDPSPRKSKASGSALPAKRKVPGESLINPGFKSKKAPSGVNFEDS